MKAILKKYLSIVALGAFVVFAFSILPSQLRAQSYIAQPGDTLQVEVIEDSGLNRSVLVLPGGQVSFPFAGTFQASGRSLGQIGNVITSALAPNFAARPTVFVSVARISDPQLPEPVAEPETISVYAMGEVAAPGLKKVEPGTTIVQFLSQVGGFTNFAATKRVQLRRTDPQTGAESVYTINYDALQRGATIRSGNRIIEGDVFLVPERGLFE